MTQAHIRCAALDLDFSDTFRFQYLISRRDITISEFTSHRLGKATMQVGAATHFARLTDANGVVFALMVGIAVDPTGLVAGDHVAAGVNAESLEFWDQFETYIVDLAGRYTILAVQGDEERVYVDPVGMNGCVYERSTERVAASPLLCIDRDMIDNPLFDHEIVEASGGKYSLFHTRDAYIRRMNPNCYLDLDNFHELRFWPRDETFTAAPDAYGALASTITNTLSHNIAAIARAFLTAMPITGGRDSRILLAAAGPALENIDQIYSHINNYATKRDAEIGQAICQELDIEHEMHHWRDFRGVDWQSRQQAAHAFQTAYGAPVAPPTEVTNSVVSGLADGAVVLRGHQTDLLRAVFVPYADKRHWKKFRWQLRKLLIVPQQMFNTKVYDTYLPDYLAWLRTLPRNALTKQIDFMFLEIYYNASIGASFPALSRNFYMSPFNSRRLITLALSYDDAYRIAANPVDDLIYDLNPAVHAIPYDDDIGADLAELIDQKRAKAATKSRVSQTIQRAVDLRRVRATKTGRNANAQPARSLSAVTKSGPSGAQSPLKKAFETTRN